MNNDDSLLIALPYIIFLFLLSCAKTVNPDSSGNSDFLFGSNTSLDIVTWNIEHFPKDDRTIGYVSDMIERMGADIIGLQEISDTESFLELIDSLGDGWTGFRSSDSGYGELSYLINTNEVDIMDEPYTILKSEEYYFANREPFVLDVSYKGTSYSIINVHFKCCGDGTIGTNESDEENRREKASQYLAGYISDNLSQKRLLVIGDFNDHINDAYNDNVFKVFIDFPDTYYFTDLQIANGSTHFWSYPSWPSHLDHILINSNLFSSSYVTETIKVESTLSGGWPEYDQYISDHRPVGIRILD